MSQVNKYTDNAAYEADETRSKSRSALSYIENNAALRYDGVNVVVGRDAAAEGDLAVYDKADSVIRFVKGATLDADTLPAELLPAAVVYGRRGDRVRVVSLENVSAGTRWAASYEVALSGFDLLVGGTFVLKFGGSSDVSVTYSAGASLAEIAGAVAAAIKSGEHDFSTAQYGGWTAAATETEIVMASDAAQAEWSAIGVVSGCEVRRTSEDEHYQTTPAEELMDGARELLRRNNYVDIIIAGCNLDQCLKYYSENGSSAHGITPGSSTIIRESVFTQDANPALVEAYPTYRDYLNGEYMVQYPSAYGAVLRDGKTNTAKIGSLRFTDIRGERVPCYPAAAAALGYGVTADGHTTGLEAGAWWLPSVEEAYLLRKNRRMASDISKEDMVNRTLSALGKDTCYSDELNMWTSCEGSASTAFIYNVVGYINATDKYKIVNIRPVSEL